MIVDVVVGGIGDPKERGSVVRLDACKERLRKLTKLL